MEMGFDCLFKGSRISGGCFKYYIPASDEGFDILEADLLKQAAQMVHLDGMASHVDGPQQRHIAGQFGLRGWWMGLQLHKSLLVIHAPKCDTEVSTAISVPCYRRTRTIERIRMIGPNHYIPKGI